MRKTFTAVLLAPIYAATVIAFGLATLVALAGAWLDSGDVS